MGTDKDKIMILKGGLLSGTTIKWQKDSGPPPETHAVLENDKLAVYERKNITPKEDAIDYIYMHDRTYKSGIDVNHSK